MENRAEATALATAALKAPASASASYRTEEHKDAWVVWNGPTPERTDRIVIIDRKTGATRVVSYSVATIDERL